MTKILIGLAAAIVIAVGGFFGIESYAQHRAAAEVEVAFDQIRAAGNIASHGKVSFDLWSRTVTIADITGGSLAQPALRVKVASFVASGVKQPDPTRFMADTVEVTDVEVGGTMKIGADVDFAYKAPRISMAGISAPVKPLRLLDKTSAADIYRLALEHFAAVTATSVTIPELTTTMNVHTGAMAQLVDYTYSNLTLRDIKGGKIAAMNAGRASFTTTADQDGRTDKIDGEIAEMATYDFDSGALLALVDPAQANDDSYRRLYRQITTGSYTAAMSRGKTMRFDGMTIDDIGVRPSRLQFSQLYSVMGMLPSPGTPVDPAKMRALTEWMAGIYEGVRVGNAEIRGMTFDTPDGAARLAAFRLNLANGTFGEVAFEGLDARTDNGPVKLGRFTLKSLDTSNLLRMVAKLSDPATPSSPDKYLGLLSLLGGVEVKDAVAPYKAVAAPVKVEHLSFDWGQFVGSMPSKVRLTAKFSAPVDAGNPGQQFLVAAGIENVAMNADLGASWTEASRTLVLEPALVELGGVMALSTRVSAGNVPREAFSADAAALGQIATQIEAGTIEIELRDLGGIDLALSQAGIAQQISSDAARRSVVDNIKAVGAAMARAYPDGVALSKTLVSFIENPRGTLKIKLTPVGKVPAMRLIESLKADPFAALARFKVEASTAR